MARRPSAGPYHNSRIALSVKRHVVADDGQTFELRPGANIRSKASHEKSQRNESLTIHTMMCIVFAWLAPQHPAPTSGSILPFHARRSASSTATTKGNRSRFIDDAIRE